MSITCRFCEKPIGPDDVCVEVLTGKSLGSDPGQWEEASAVHLRCLRPEPLGPLPLPPTLKDEDIP